MDGPKKTESTPSEEPWCHSTADGMRSSELFDALICDARVGDAEALNELLVSCRDYLLLVANHELGGHLRRKVAASDLVQSACVLAQRNIGQFRGSTHAEWIGWLRKILRNELFAAHRHFTAEKRNIGREESALDAQLRSPYDETKTPSTEAILREEALSLRESVKRLSPEHRQVILLRNWERLPFEEIGERMARSADAAKKLWSRAIQQLRRELGNDGTEESR